MQPKKRFAVKLKTLTLTLALASGINITKSFATRAEDATNAIKTRAFGDAVIDLLKYTNSNYKKATHPTEVIATTTKVAATAGSTESTTSGTTEKTTYKQVGLEDGTGAYNATGRGLVKDSDNDEIKNATAAKITGGTNLIGSRLFKLHENAKALADDGNIGDLFIGATDNNPSRLQAVLELLNTDIDGDSANNSNKPVAVKAFVDAIAKQEDAKKTLTTDYSAMAKKYTEVNAINDLNSALAALKTNLAKDDAGKLDSTARIQAFFDYAVAYVGNKTAADAIKNVSAINYNVAVDTNESSALCKAVVDALKNKEQQKKFIEKKGLHAITTNNELEAAVSMSATDLENAIILTQNNIKVQDAIQAHLEANKLLPEKAVASLVPDANNLGRGATAPVVKAVNDLVDTRMQIINNSGMSTGDEYENSNVWMRATYINYDADTKDAANLGYRQTSTGFGLGLDQQLDAKFNMGLSYNYIKSNLNGKADYKLKDDIKSNAFGVYITMMHRGMFADAQFNYIKNKIKGSRIIGAAAETSDVTYKYSSDVKNMVIGFGIDFNFDDNWYFKPKACIALSNYKNDKFNEVGGLDAALDVNQTNYTSVELGIRLIAGIDVMRENYKLQPKIKLGFMYDLNDKGDKLTYNFMGSDISVEGAKRDRANFNFGTSFGFVIDELTVDFGYDFRWSNKSKAHGFVVKVGSMF